MIIYWLLRYFEANITKKIAKYLLFFLMVYDSHFNILLVRQKKHWATEKKCSFIRLHIFLLHKETTEMSLRWFCFTWNFFAGTFVMICMCEADTNLDLRFFHIWTTLYTSIPQIRSIQFPKNVIATVYKHKISR